VEHSHRRGIYFALFLMLFRFFFNVILSVIFSLVDRFILHETEMNMLAIVTSPWFMIFGLVMTLLVPLAIWLAVFGEKINNNLPHMRLGKRNILLIIGISLMLNPVANVISGITSLFFPNEIAGIMQGVIEDYPLFLILLAVAITPAICEEVVFRGYIQSAYKNKSLLTMLLMNGFFFAIIHQSPQQFFYAFAMGIIFAYMVYATRSIRAGVIAHFIMNASSIMLAWIASHILNYMESLQLKTEPENIPELSEQAQILTAVAFWGVIAMFTSTAAVFLFREFITHNKKRVAEYEAKNTVEEVLCKEEPTQKRKNLITDTALILAIVALYVIFVLA